MECRARNRPLAPDNQAKTAIYRPFFLAGMAAVLTTGCSLGAVALAGIAASRGSASSDWTPYIQAHANSQLYGWVGLFVMGFALQQHPPRVSRAMLFHRLAWTSLVLVLAGIALRFAAEPLAAARPGVAMRLGLFSACLEAAAVFVFVANIGLTRCRTLDPQSGEQAGLPWQSVFVFASLGWWMLAAAIEPGVFAATHAADRREIIAFIATWGAPYRDAQFLGFVVNMIFGVALARFSTDFGAPPASKPLGLFGFALWNTSLVVRAVGWVSYVRAGMTPDAALLYHVGGALLCAAAVMLTASSGIFSGSTPPSAAEDAAVGTRNLRGGIFSGAARPLPGRKFVRAALGWLLCSGLMIVLEPAHLAATGAVFSHAYTGAVRHAITVGFISQMIVGVSMTVVPTFVAQTRSSNTSPGSLWATFWLLNGGNALRVASQVATDYSHRAFPLMGATGFVELTAIALWAISLGGVILGRKSALTPAAQSY